MKLALICILLAACGACESTTNNYNSPPNEEDKPDDNPAPNQNRSPSTTNTAEGGSTPEVKDSGSTLEDSSPLDSGTSPDVVDSGSPNTPVDSGADTGTVVTADSGTCTRNEAQDATCQPNFTRAWLCPAPIPPENVCITVSSSMSGTHYCCR